MTQKLQSVRGTKDLCGKEINIFNHVIDIAKKYANIYGFNELSTPIFEFSEVYERNLGQDSDIISKEVYKFVDKGDNFLTLRPEFTAGIVRAFISSGVLSQILPQKFFSFGPIFRYDRPQKGRQRQFHQINFETIGIEHFLGDVESILLANTILENLGISQKASLQINSLGCENTKEKYQNALQEYFIKYQNDLSDDSKVRLKKNPLRILDSKDKNDISLVQNSPKIADFYEKASRQNFENILQNLSDNNITYQVNQRLVRGLDYYTSTVFEFVTGNLGAQNTILAGGRYDNLIAKMGGNQTPAIGFAAGVERLMLLSSFDSVPDRPISVIYVDSNQQNIAFQLVEDLRKSQIYAQILFGSNLKKQFKKAGQINSKFAIVIGEDEVKTGEFTIKNFDSGQEEKVERGNIKKYLQSTLISTFKMEKSN